LKKPHGVVVFLPPELYIGVVKLQADKELGKPYAVLLALNEGLYSLGYISKEAYEVYSKKYSEKLIKEEVKLPTPQEQLEIARLSASFQNIIKNWNEVKNKEFWIKKAEGAIKKYGEANILEAKQILALAQKVEADSSYANI